MPYLSLAVDGLTDASEGKKGKLELRPEDVAVNEAIRPDTTMPVAVLNYLLAEKYQRSPAEVASLVVVSTLLSLVALPLILAWVL